VGISFTPGTAANGNLMSLTSTDGSAYYDAPRFYIQHLVDPSDPLGLLSTTKFYQIDAVGYGGSGSAVAVVRATFSVHTETNGMGGP
jgi:Tfp pilus assembly protein PilX